jgi:hypothetical protein
MPKLVTAPNAIAAGRCSASIVATAVDGTPTQ